MLKNISKKNSTQKIEPIECLRKETMDSPTSDFATQVRASLLAKGAFFAPIDSCPNKPLSPVPTPSTASTPSATL